MSVTIGQLPVASSVAQNDYLIVETAGGTKKTQVSNIKPEFVVLNANEDLPATGANGTFYFKPNGDAGANSYDEYVWVPSKNDGAGGYENLGPRTITITTDATPTQNSTNPVQSGGVYTALQNVAITKDSVPTQNSTNAVESGGVYSALQGIVETTTTDPGEGATMTSQLLIVYE